MTFIFKHPYSILFFLAFWGMSLPELQAQNTGQISGYVKDAKTDEPLIGVTIQIDGTSLGGVTNLEGYYLIKNIPTTAYNITASYIGYESLTRYNVIIRSGTDAGLNFELNEISREIDEIVIRSSPFSKLEETPLSIQRLTREEIVAYPGGDNDIAKVVQSLPGVSGSIGGFRNDVIIRGGAPNENVYYLDGVEIPNINHFATQGSAGGPVGLLNVSFFEGVTLATSAFEAKYDNVLSGVLQFDQRNGNAKNFQTNIRVGASEAALTFEGPLFKGKNQERSRTTFIASARRSYLQLLFQVLELPFLPDYWDYQFKINHQIDKYNEINIIGLGSIDDFAINAEDDLTDEEQASLDQVPIIKQWTTTTGISWRRRFKDNSGFMRTTLSSNAFHNNFTRFEDNRNRTDKFFENNSLEWENKLRYELTKFFGDWTLNSGLLFQTVRYTNQTFDDRANVDFEVKNNFARYGLFAQISKSFMNERFQASFGLRADGNTFTEKGNDLTRTLSPRLSLSVQLDKAAQWNLNFSVGRYYKIPTYTVLGFQDQNGNFVNENARYIRSDHAVVGVEFLPSPSTRITLEGFYKRYRNYPVSIQDSVSLANLGADFEVLGNEAVESVGLGRTYGLEFLIQQKLTKNFYGILAYTFYYSEYTGFDGDNYLPSAWDNRHIVTFTGGYKLPRNWEVAVRLRYLGRAPFPIVDQEASVASYPDFVFDYQRLGEQRLETFNALDIRIDKKWNFSSWNLQLYFEVQNALASAIPTPPVFGLRRDEAGNQVIPRELIEVTELSNSTIIPTLGIVVDF